MWEIHNEMSPGVDVLHHACFCAFSELKKLQIRLLNCTVNEVSKVIFIWLRISTSDLKQVGKEYAKNFNYKYGRISLSFEDTMS